MGWQNRIKRLVYKPAHQLQPNPANARLHPQKQQDALMGALESIGLVGVVTENLVSGFIIDGHLRHEKAMSIDPDMSLPVLEVELDEQEEKLFLTSFDWITQLAEYDRDMLDTLLHDVQTDDTNMQAMLSEMAELNGVIPVSADSWGDAFSLLPDEDRAPFQQKAFTLHDSQVSIIDDAICLANTLGDYDGSPNENSNGNALARICEIFLNGQS